MGPLLISESFLSQSLHFEQAPRHTAAVGLVKALKTVARGHPTPPGLHRSLSPPLLSWLSASPAELFALPFAELWATPAWVWAKLFTSTLLNPKEIGVPQKALTPSEGERTLQRGLST